MKRWVAILLATAGCDRVFGLGDPYQHADSGIDAPVDSRPSAPKPLAYFPFDVDLTDEVSGNKAINVSGTTVTISPTPCEKNGCANFGAGSCVKFSLPEAPPTYTISLWVMTLGGFASETPLVARPEPSIVGSYDGKLTATTMLLRFYAANSDSVDSMFMATSPMAWNMWHHLAVIYNGNDMTFYVDGTQTMQHATVPAIDGTGTALYLGCDGSMMGTMYSGYLDEVHIYEGVLSATDLAGL
jgi:hypothetical protein